MFICELNKLRIIKIEKVRTIIAFSDVYDEKKNNNRNNSNRVIFIRQ